MVRASSARNWDNETSVISVKLEISNLALTVKWSIPPFSVSKYNIRQYLRKTYVINTLYAFEFRETIY